LFFNGRKIGRDQKLCDVKGLTAGKNLRILNLRKFFPKVSAPADLREKVVELDERFKTFGIIEDRSMTSQLFDKNYIKNLFIDFPIILEEPILLNVLTDYSLMSAMLHEEHGFIQQHPSYVPILQKILSNAMPNSAPEFMNLLRSALSPRRQRTNAAYPGPSQALPRPQITNDMLQQALLTTRNLVEAANNSVSNAAESDGRADEPMQVAAPIQSTVNRYAAELTQLHDMGFTDDAVNIVILDSVDGNVEAATNLLFAMRD
jgi:hypothetical protein